LVADRRIGALDYESYLVTESVEATTDAAQIVGKESGGTNEALLRLGRIVGNLHLLGIYHDDLKASHILLTSANLPDHGLEGIVLIDLYRCAVGRRPSLRRRGVNLAQILISLPDWEPRQAEPLLAGFMQVLPTSALGKRLLERAVASALASRRKRRARQRKV